VRWRPILLGALFKRIGTPEVPLFAMSAPKRAHVAADLRRWAAYWQVPLGWPSRFPMRSVAALRLALAAEAEGKLPALTHALFSAYWVADRDLADRGVLAEVAKECGVGAETVERALAPEVGVKQALIDSTEEAIAAGVCGVPSFVVRGHLFWGQDRLDLVARTLGGWEPPTE
jgi:2-hydroxychromene-2-carboxylate isomerase